MIQIIIRTGQPGANPENEVVLKYKINDYKDKTELSAQKLFTCLVSALRSYQELVKVKQNKLGLDKIIVATQQLSKATSIPLFMDGVLSQLITLIDYCERSFVFEITTTPNEPTSDQKIQLMSSFGSEQITDFDEFIAALQHRVINNCGQYQLLTKSKEYVVRFEFGSACRYALYLEAGRPLNNLDIELLNILSGNIQVALNNLCIYQELLQSQQAVINQCLMRPASTPNLVQINNIANLSYQLACDSGLAENTANNLKDALLFCTQNMMKQQNTAPNIEHINQAVIPHIKSLRPNLLNVLLNVLQHQDEHYDGNGLPLRLTGTQISIEARIVSVVQTFDRLVHCRDYKSAWPISDIIKLFKQQRGLHFDPQLVDLLLEDIDKYHHILTQDSCEI